MLLVTLRVLLLGERLITDNVLVASEINHFLKRKKQGIYGIAALKVDIGKAHDRMEKGFSLPYDG